MCTWWGPVLLSWCDPLAHNPRLSFHPVYHYRTPQILQIPTLDLIFMLISVLNSADLILLPKDIKKTLNLVLFWRGFQWWSQKRTAFVFLCRTQINKWWEFLKKKKTNRMSLSEKAVVVVRLQPIMATSTSYRQFFVVIMHAFKVIDFFFFFLFFKWQYLIVQYFPWKMILAYNCLWNKYLHTLQFWAAWYLVTWTR